MIKKEQKYYGIHACLALFSQRKNDVIRVYLEKELLPIFSPLLKWCAENKKAYHIVPKEELEKITESVHHEGICILAVEKVPLSFPSFLMHLDAKKEAPICLLYLDGVQNPHNLGSILRTCVHFSIPFILGEKSKLPTLSGSACRIAKGGSELVSFVYVENIENDLKRLQEKNFSFLATSSHEGTSLYKYAFPKKTLLILGAEDKGISKTLMQKSKDTLTIPGSGIIDSLNVSVATGLFIAEYWRQHRS
ncbi:MAG: TrmH family RNA methyltransferase [Chlamydiota bacterium]